MAVSSHVAADLFYRIRDLQFALRSLTSLQGDAGLGFALQAVMMFIGEDEVRAGPLAAQLVVSPSVLSRQVAGLENRGLVIRRPDPKDRRAQLLALTPSGRQALERVQKERAEAFRGWSETEVLRAADVLEKLTLSLRSHHAKQPGAASS